MYSGKVLTSKHCADWGGQNLDFFSLFQPMRVGSHYRKEVDASQGYLVPVRWTCGKCLAVLLDLRKTHWQGHHGAIACWPFAPAPYQMFAEGKLEMRNHRLRKPSAQFLQKERGWQISLNAIVFSLFFSDVEILIFVNVQTKSVNICSHISSHSADKVIHTKVMCEMSMVSSSSEQNRLKNSFLPPS